MRVTDFLADQDVPFETVLHAPAFTAQKLARFTHVPGRQVAKSVLLRGPRQYYLAVVPAIHHVDLEALADALGEPIRLATEDEVNDLFLDCERGALTPFGSLYGLVTLLDTSFHPDALVLFEAQRHFLAIRMLCRDFESLEHPRRLSFARRARPGV